MTRSRFAAAALGPALLFTACVRGPSVPELAQAEDLRLAEAPTLSRALASRDAALEERAILALGRVQAAGSATVLAPRVAASQPRAIRLAALFALGQLGLAEGAGAYPPAVTAVRTALADPDPEIVALAVEALGKLAPADAEADLLRALAAPAVGVRERAAYALFRLRFVPPWRKQTAEPPALSDTALAALAVASRDPEPAVRRAAVYASSRFGEPRAVPALVAALSDRDPLTRLFALRALGRSGAGVEAAVLVPLLGDSDEQVRAEAMLALGALGHGELAPATVADDPSFQVRAALARALASGETAAGAERIRPLLADPSPTVRAAATESLARRLGAAFVPELAGFAGDGDWRQRVAAVHGASAVGASGVPLLRQALADRDARVRTAAVEGLAAQPGKEIDQLLFEALRVDDLAVRGAAVGALSGRPEVELLPAFEAALADSQGEAWIEVRESLVAALAELPAAEARLTTLAREDAAPSVRSRARLAHVKRGVEVPAEAATAATPSRFLGQALGEGPIVVLETRHGKLRIQCFSQEAPLHVASFLSLVRAGYYDGLIWHRVVPNFVIQGGDPRGDGSGGPGYTLRDEINRRPFLRGTVGMPKAGKDTGGGQLFITHLPTPHLDGNYTVFGQVIAGLEVIDRIEVGDAILRAYTER